MNTDLDCLAKHRVILLVDDDSKLMYDYHNWISRLSFVYSRLYCDSRTRLYDRLVYAITDLDPVLDSIGSSIPSANLDLVITDFDLITSNGNDVAKIVRAKFPNTKIIGNTGGDKTRFDKSLVDFAVDKITDVNTFYDVIDKNTRLKLDSGVDIFSRAMK